VDDDRRFARFERDPRFERVGIGYLLLATRGWSFDGALPTAGGSNALVTTSCRRAPSALRADRGAPRR
jgi:hypothetical protein